MYKSGIPYNSAEDSKYNFTKKKRKVILNIVDDKDFSCPSPTDPLGMYTGVPHDPNDIPVQDADDL